MAKRKNQQVEVEKAIGLLVRAGVIKWVDCEDGVKRAQTQFYFKVDGNDSVLGYRTVDIFVDQPDMPPENPVWLN